MLRRAIALIMALLLTVAVAACAPERESPDPTAQALAKGLAAKDVSTVAFADATGAQVQEQLAELTKGMDAWKPNVTATSVEEVESNLFRATLSYDWPAPDSEKGWSYTTTADLHYADDRWQVRWTPKVLEPSLAEGERLVLATKEPQRGQILDADGEAIVKNRPVKLVGIDKTGLDESAAEESARELAALVDVDAAGYAKKVAAYGPKAFVDAITLREGAFKKLDQGKLEDIDGFLAVDDQLPLAPSRTFAGPVLGSVREATAEDIEKSEGKVVAGETVGSSGLQAAFNKELSGTPGVTVSAVAQPAEEGADAPTRQLFHQDPADGKDLKSTLVPDLQSAAEDILANTKSPSSIVALRPSTGAVLAAANGPDSEGYNTAFLGQYAPGSTFKIATALGLLRNGMTPDSAVTCDPELVVDGRTFENADSYPAAFTGKITLTEAIAHSCNTAFISEYQKLSQDQLADAAGALGVGMTANPGIEAFLGTVPREDSEGTAHAASMIGQSRVQTSPLSLATLMAAVVKGGTVVPTLVDGHDPEAKLPDVPKLTEQEAKQLRTMMRSAVVDGYLANLADLPGKPAIGKTGTAEYGSENPPQTHSWVIAGHGDLAIAVFVEDGKLGAETAGPLAEAFLEAAAR
ncbi:MAG TPA: penicillin-binding transpeptidase domain-containing protein [Arthrobacter sp.]|nr:penicillin-binding transpeptidase domain-containing protein [Arthrobacter sp.]